MQEANYINSVFVAPEELASGAAIEVHAEAEGPMQARSGSNKLAFEYGMLKLCGKVENCLPSTPKYLGRNPLPVVGSRSLLLR
jgi:hypothetical protein